MPNKIHSVNYKENFLKGFYFMKNFLLLILLFISINTYADISYLKKELTIQKVYLSGNDLQLAHLLGKTLLEFPENPANFFYLNDLYSLEEVCGHKYLLTICEKLLIKISKLNSAKFNLLRMHLLRIKSNLEYQYRKKNYSLFSKTYYPLNNWSSSGPFYKYGNSDLYYPFLQKLTQFERKKSFRQIKVKDPEGYFYPQNYYFPEKGIIYLNKSLYLSKPIRLRVESNCNYILSLNNEEIIENNEKKTFRQTRIIQIKNIFSIKLRLKLKIISSSYFRIIATDLKNRPYVIKKGIDNSGIKKGSYLEILDYPYNYYINQKKKKNSHAGYRLGKFFSLLKSRESLSYYEKYYQNKKSIFAAQQYAEELIKKSQINSADNFKGWQILKNLWEKNNHAVPITFRKLEYLQQQGPINKIIPHFKILFNRLQNYLPFQKNRLNYFYKNNYENELFNSINKFKKRFPFSLYDDFILIKYNLNKNSSAAIQICKSILKRKKDIYIAQKLINLLIQREKYIEALLILKEFLEKDNLKMELKKAELLIMQKKHLQAKKQLMMLLLQKQDPLIYYLLGKNQLAQKKNADLYWSKLESLLPDAEFPADYLNYRLNSKIVSPLDSLRNKIKINEIISKFLKQEPIYNTILFRGHYYLLKTNGKGKHLNEELIYIKNESDIKNWEKYRIPYSQNIKIYAAKTYHSDGKSYCAYKIQSTPQGKFITLNNIKNNSLLHIIYQKNKFFKKLSNSQFIYTSPISLQNYNENISYYEVKAFSPQKTNLNLYINKNIPIKKKVYGDQILFSFQKQSPSKIEHNKDCDDWKNLITYSFENFKEYNDLVFWYKGNWPAKRKINYNNYFKIQKNGSIRNKIITIYNFIANEISLEGNLFYSPQDYQNILFYKKGSIEDKVFLAQAVLNYYGIKSFPALVKSEFSCQNPKNSLYGKIQTILLYIPIKNKKQIWLDFSSDFQKADLIRKTPNKKALIILKNKIYEKIIPSSESKDILSEHDIIKKTK